MGAAVSRQGDNFQSGRFRAGDETVLREVWQTYAPALARRLVSRFPGLLQPCDAEDLINAALHRAWRGRETFDSTKPFPFWLWSVVYSVAVSQFRRQGSRRRRGSRIGQETVTDPFLLDLRPASCPQEDDGVPSIHHCGISSQELWAAVYRLPPNWQAIVRAHARAPNGCANNRILAKELGLTVGTVREYYRRAMARLKHELGLLVAERERERERERDVNKFSSCVVGVSKGEGRPNVARVVSPSWSKEPRTASPSRHGGRHITSIRRLGHDTIHSFRAACRAVADCVRHSSGRLGGFGAGGRTAILVGYLGH
jgi:RNA polymerase sigma factor (sigma-70 family)